MFNQCRETSGINIGISFGSELHPCIGMKVLTIINISFPNPIDISISFWVSIVHQVQVQKRNLVHFLLLGMLYNALLATWYDTWYATG